MPTETENESYKQKLITEFTPFIGLRLRVPLQWVLIQLIASNGTYGSGNQLQQLQNRMLDKSLQDFLFWKLQIGLQKAKKPNYNRVQSTFTLTASEHLQQNSPNAYWLNPWL